MTSPSTSPSLRPFDLAAYAEGNTGVPYFHTIAGGGPGPHLMIVALVHGNESCGALALHHLFENHVRSRQGRLTLGFCNVAAAQRGAPCRFSDDDFNRVWAANELASSRSSTELDRARQIRSLVDQVDFLLDLHSMQTTSPPLALAGLTDKGLALARRLGAPHHIVCDAGHPQGLRLRDYARFSDPGSERAALLVECGQHVDQRSVDVAIDVALRFIARAVGGETTPAGPQRVIRVTEVVTIATESFRFAQAFSGLEVIPSKDTIIAWDGDRAIRTPHDRCVLVMPSRRLRPGQTAVRLVRYEN